MLRGCPRLENFELQHYHMQRPWRSRPTYELIACRGLDYDELSEALIQHPTLKTLKIEEGTSGFSSNVVDSNVRNSYIRSLRQTTELRDLDLQIACLINHEPLKESVETAINKLPSSLRSLRLKNVYRSQPTACLRAGGIFR